MCYQHIFVGNTWIFFFLKRNRPTSKPKVRKYKSMSVEFKSEQLGSQTIKDKIGHAAVSRHQRKGLVLSLHTSQTDERCCLCTAIQGWASMGIQG